MFPTSSSTTATFGNNNNINNGNTIPSGTPTTSQNSYRFANINLNVQQKQQSGSVPPSFSNASNGSTNMYGSSQPTLNTNSGLSSNFMSSTLNSNTLGGTTSISVPSNFHLNGNAPYLDNSQFQQHDNHQKNDTMWYNNPKKRSIPEVLIRRSAYRQNSSNNSDGASTQSLMTTKKNPSVLLTKSDFNSISFGKNNDYSNNLNQQENNSKNLFTFDNDNEAPPSVSLHDWQREDELASISPSSYTKANLFNTFISKRQVPSINNALADNNSTFGSNMFDKSFIPNAKDKDLSNVSISSGNFTLQDDTLKDKFSDDMSLTPNTSLMLKGNGKSLETPIDNNAELNKLSETAIIVFGYSETASNLIISHFSRFGNILEDFQILRGATGLSSKSAGTRLRSTIKSKSTQTVKKYPIFTGEGWVKLTYDSPASAIRALEENGTVFNGSLIGCIPYSRAAIEQLGGCKIDDSDDIGNANMNFPNMSISTSAVINNRSDNNSISNISSTPISSVNTNTPSTINQIGITPYTSHKLNIKDGASLFIRNTNTENHGILSSLEKKIMNSEIKHQRQNVDSTKQQSGIMNTVNNWLFGWNDL